MADGLQEVEVCRFDELEDPGCKEFRIGSGDWPFKGFVVRQGSRVFAYQNFCVHVGHPLNWSPNRFLTEEGDKIICSSHGALYDISTGNCAGGPCKGRSLRTVDCEVRGGSVYVRGPTNA